MFQKGTGERFKYKKAVKENFPNAICRKYSFGTSTILTYYIVNLGTSQLSASKSTAEGAWIDAWMRYCKTLNELK
jgi:hypothetical protein